nr:OmpP1/FadL family transporter [Paramesorhizobium deserti]
MIRGTTKTIVGAALIAAGAIGSAQAGGLERSSQDFDILFEPGTRIESGVTFVMPQRKLRNIRGSAVGTATGGINPRTGRPYKTSVDEAVDYAVPKFSAKVDLNDDLACAAQYREPIGIHTDVGTDTAAMYVAIEQEITSRDYGLNCSYRFVAGEKGYFRILGGVSYQEVEGYQSRFLPRGFPDNPLGRLEGFRTGYLNVEDKSWGWRLGAAYEIPEYALRASVVYQSRVKYNLEGTITGLFSQTVPVIPVEGEAEVPDSVEVKFQTGIAPNWLAFGSVKWTNWSIVKDIPFYNTAAGLIPVGARITGLDLYYQDGWTISGGVAHKLNDQWSVASSLTWDRATTTGLTSQTDVWTLGLGTVYSPNERFEVRLAGVVGLLTSGTMDNRRTSGLAGYVADFDDDFVGALSISAKLKF